MDLGIAMVIFHRYVVYQRASNVEHGSHPPFFFVAIHSSTLPAASDTQLLASRLGDVAQGGGRMDALAQDEACHVRIPWEKHGGLTDSPKEEWGCR